VFRNMCEYHGHAKSEAPTLSAMVQNSWPAFHAPSSATAR
jgi:hypothetical protein